MFAFRIIVFLGSFTKRRKNRPLSTVNSMLILLDQWSCVRELQVHGVVLIFADRASWSCGVQSNFISEAH